MISYGCSKKEANEEYVKKLEDQRDGMVKEDGSDLILSKSVGYSLQKVEKADYIDSISYKGRLVNLNQYQLSFKEQVTFSRFLVEEGEEVYLGQPLAEGVNERYDTLIHNTYKDLDALYDSKEKREILYQKEGIEKDALKKDYKSAIDYKLHQVAITQLEQEFYIDMKVLEQEIKALEDDIARYKEERNVLLVAPNKGKVDKLGYVKEGEIVDATRWLIQMHNQEEAYIEVTDDKKILLPTMKVVVEGDLDSKKIKLEGMVVRSERMIKDKKDLCYIKLSDFMDDNKESNLDKLNNIMVTIKTVDLKDVIVIDKHAIGSEKGKKYVQIYEDGVIKKRYVVLGPNNSEQSCILSGIDVGMEIVVSN